MLFIEMLESSELFFFFCVRAETASVYLEALFMEMV